MKNWRRTFTVMLALVACVGVSAQEADLEVAVFAGGCFWCMEKPFDELDGVRSTTSGFAGGHVECPSYQEVTRGGTGHREVVEIVYDPSIVGYETLLYVYWRNVDPFDGGGQFCDRGHSYSPAIYTSTREQAELARASLEVIKARFVRSIDVAIEPLDAFYAAEEYHQNYYEKNPIRYNFYRTSCGRDRRLESVWADEARGEEPQPWLPHSSARR